MKLSFNDVRRYVRQSFQTRAMLLGRQHYLTTNIIISTEDCERLRSSVARCSQFGIALCDEMAARADHTSQVMSK